MAASSSSTSTSMCCALRLLPSPSPHRPHALLRLSSPSLNFISISLGRNNSSSSLSFCKYLSAFPLTLPTLLSPIPFGEQKQKQKPLTVFAKKGYKMKTNKAAAKRFRVTGKGKIVRRKAGKQHLLAKKNSKRRNRLSKMVVVNRTNYDNVIGALPYLKVNRKVT